MKVSMCFFHTPKLDKPIKNCESILMNPILDFNGNVRREVLDAYLQESFPKVSIRTSKCTRAVLMSGQRKITTTSVSQVVLSGITSHLQGHEAWKIANR